MVRIGFTNKKGRPEDTLCLLDSGNSAGHLVSDNTLININFCADYGIPVVEVSDKIEAVNVGTPTNPLKEPLRYCFPDIAFRGETEKGAPIEFADKFTVPGGTYTGNQ